MNTGWICPRCSVVHAPSVLRCECKAAEKPAVVPGEMLKQLEKYVREGPQPPPRPRGIIPGCPNCGRYIGSAPIPLPGYCAHPPAGDTPIRESFPAPRLRRAAE